MITAIKIIYRIIGVLPMRLIYAWATINYYLIYYVFRYRRATVAENLNKIFPNYTPNEIKNLEKKFYRHFSDVILEAIKFANSDKKLLDRHLSFTGLDKLNQVKNENKSFILTAAHLGNWEVFLHIAKYIDVPLYVVYKTIRNPKGETLFSSIRSLSDALMISEKQIKRFYKSLKSETVGLALLADQAPQDLSTGINTQFLGQENTIFVKGPEAIARKYNLPVFYLEISKPKRGQYKLQVINLVQNPKQLKEHELTHRYAKRLEENIMRQPELWLWSYARWKTRE